MAVEINNGGLYWKARIDTSDLEADAKRITDVIEENNKKQLDAHDRLVRETSKKYRGLVNIAKEEFAMLPAEVQKSFSAIQSLTKELDQIKRAEKQLAAERKLGRITQDEYNKSTLALANLRRDITSQVKTETAEITKNIKALDLQKGSIKSLEVQLATAREAYKSLSQHQRENTQAGRDLMAQIVETEKRIDSANNRVKDLAKTYNESVTSISAYKRQLSELATEYDKLSTAERGGAKGSANLDQTARIQKQIQETERLKKSTLENLTVFRDTSQSLENLGHRVSILTSRYAQLSVAQRQDPNIGGKIQEEIRAYQQQIDSVQKYNNAIRQNIAIQNMASGSMDQKRAKLQQLVTQWNALSEAERRNANIGGQLQREIRGLDREVSKLDRSLRSTAGGSVLMNQVLMATAGLFTITQGSRLVKDIINVRGEIEQLEVAFSTMLRSKSRADELMREVVQVATTTPYTLTEVADATKQLLAYGFAQEEIKQELLAVGNVASGVGATFQEVAYAYGTLKTQGRAFARDIRQFTTRGIPIVAELAKQFNVTEKEVNDMVTAGKIGFPEVQKAFQSMTGAGGMFFNLMEKQSATVTGELAKLQDRIQLMFNEIGKVNDGLIKSGIAGLSFLVENYEDVIKILGTLVISYGSYRAALVLASAAQALYGASGLSLTRMLAVLRLAQMKLNAVMLANPYVLVATAIGTLVGAIYMFTDEVKKAEDAQTRLNRASSETAKVVGEQEAKVKSLASTLRNSNVAESVRLKAYEDLKALSPDIVKGLTFEEAKTKDLTKSVYAYVDALRKRIQTENLTQESIKLAQERAELEERLVKSQQGLEAERSKGERRRSMGEMSNIQMYETEVKGIQRQIETIANAERQINDQIASAFDSSQDGIRNEIKRLEEVRDAYNKTSKQYKEYEERIIELRQSLTKTDDPGPSQNKAYFEEIIKTNTELLEDLDKSSTEFLEKSKEYKDKIKEAQENLKAFSVKDDIKQENKDAREAAAEREKILDEINRMETKAFKRSHERNEQEIADTKRKYNELREAAREAGFNAEGTVISRIDNIEKKDLEVLDYRVKTEDLKKELETRRQLYADYENHIRDFGIKAANEKYAAELDVAKTYLDRIQEEYDKLIAIEPKNRSGAESERFQFLHEQLENEKRQQTQQHNELLKATQDYHVKRQLIVEQYEHNRAALIKNGNTQNLAELERQFDEEIKAHNDANTKKFEGFEEFFNNIEYKSRKAAIDGVEVLISKLEELKGKKIEEGGISDEFYKDTLKQLQNIKKNVQDEIPEAFGEWANSLNEIGNTIGDANQGFAQMIGLVANLLQRTAKLKSDINAFRSARESDDTMGMATSGAAIGVGIASGVIQIMDMISSAAKRRKEEEERFYKSVTSLQNEYNQSLVEQIRLQSILAENVFLADYEGRITDASKALIDATESYQDAIKKLGSGTVISGQRNKVDWDNVGKGALTGAAVGAGIGSIVPIVGTVVGAVAGGIVGFFSGLFGGKKKVDNYVPLLQEYPELIQQTEDGVLSINKELAETLMANNLLSDSTKVLLEDVMKWGEEIEKSREQIKGVISDLAGSLGNDIRNDLVEAFRAGEDAALRMGKTVEKVLENMLSQLAFNKFFSGIFDQLEKEMAASMDIGGDGDWMDDLARFFKGMSDGMPGFNRFLEDLQKQGSQYGFDLFQPDPAPQPKGLSGAIRRELTEETGSELAGLYRAMYDLQKAHHNTAFEHLKAGVQQVNQLIAIERNTANTVAELKSAVVELKGINANTKPITSWRGYTP